MTTSAAMPVPSAASPFLFLALCLGALCSPAPAQRPDLAPWEPELDPPLSPTVIFTYSFPESEPNYFAIAVNALGNGAYESRGVVGISGELREPYLLKFTFSEASRRRIFDLAAQLDYFSRDFNFKGRRVAQMGSKTLTYKDANRRVETSFNWSEDRAIQELSAIFHRVSTTLESGRRLQYLRRFDRLGLDAELKFLEQQVQEKKVAEMHAIASLLREIAADSALMRVVRDRAQRILKRSGESRQEPSQAEDAAAGVGPSSAP